MWSGEEEGKKARENVPCLACEHLFLAQGLLRGGHLLLSTWVRPSRAPGLAEDFLFRRSSQGIDGLWTGESLKSVLRRIAPYRGPGGRLVLLASVLFACP